MSFAEMAGVSSEAICKVATWSSKYTFARFYQLNLVAQADAEFGRRVLQVAGSLAADKGMLSKHLQQYKIPKLKKA